MAALRRRQNLKSLTSLSDGSQYLLLAPCQRCMSIDFSLPELQPPQPIDEFLRAHNIPDTMISAVSTVFMERASQLFTYTRTKLKRLLTSIPCLPGRCTGRSSRLMSSPIIMTWVGHYEDQLAWWRENCLSMGVRLSQSRNDEREGTRSRFNQSSTAFLEAYFELNYYPSLADRQALAERTGNTPKQIADWFQNHRSRGKKGGRRIERTNTEPTFDEILSVLERQLPPSIFTGMKNNLNDVTPGNFLSPTATEPDIEADHSPSILHVSSYSAAPHAFPAKYSSRRKYDSFPSHPKFAEIQWQRRPFTKSRSRCSVEHDIDAVINKFANTCSIRGSTLKRKRSDPPDVDRVPWTAAATMTTTPPPAPLPALVRDARQYNAGNRVQPPCRHILPLPHRALNVPLTRVTAGAAVTEELEPPQVNHQHEARRKIPRLASGSNTPTPPFPLTPVQGVIPLSGIADDDLSSQLSLCLKTPYRREPLTALKAISKSFLDYASLTIPFGSSCISMIGQVH